MTIMPKSETEQLLRFFLEKKKKDLPDVPIEWGSYHTRIACLFAEWYYREEAAKHSKQQIEEILNHSIVKKESHKDSEYHLCCKKVHQNMASNMELLSKRIDELLAENTKEQTRRREAETERNRLEENFKLLWKSGE